jgi:hypothetical protein
MADRESQQHQSIPQRDIVQPPSAPTPASEADGPAHDASFRKLNWQRVMHLLQHRPVVVVGGLWVTLFGISLLSSLIIMSPRFAERPELPPPQPTASVPTVNYSLQRTQILSVLSLISLVGACSLGSLMIVQRLRPPARLTRSTYRRVARQSPPSSLSPSESAPAESSKADVTTDGITRSAHINQGINRFQPSQPSESVAGASAARTTPADQSTRNQSPQWSEPRPPASGDVLEPIALDELDLRHQFYKSTPPT